MKKISLLCILFVSSTAFAEHLHNYEQIKSAILSGKSIRFVMDLSKCTTSAKNMQQLNYNSAYTPNEIMINNDKGYIAASLLHFTLSDPQFPAKPVYGFVRHTINSDGTIMLSVQTLDAVNYTALSESHTYTCEIDKGANIYS